MLFFKWFNILIITGIMEEEDEQRFLKWVERFRRSTQVILQRLFTNLLNYLYYFVFRP